MKREVKIGLQIAGGIFALFLCIYYWPNIAAIGSKILGAAVPLLIGCVIAYPVSILMSFFERHWFNRTKKKWLISLRSPISLIFAILSLLAIIALVIWLVVPQLVSCFKLIIDLLPGVFNDLSQKIIALNVLPDDWEAMLKGIDWQSRIGQIAELLTTGVGNIMDTLLKAIGVVFDGIVTGFLAIIFALYILLARKTLKRQGIKLMERYLKPSLKDKVLYVLSVLNDSFHKFFVGQCTEALILGVLCTVGMLIFQFPYATMIGAFIAFTALIPVAGAYIGAGVGAFMILTVSPIKALLFIVFIVVLQQLEGNLIYPKVVGSSIGLPGIWVLAAVTIGGGVMGVGGMLIGVPVAAAIYRIIKEDVNNKCPLTATVAAPPQKKPVEVKPKTMKNKVK